MTEQTVCEHAERDTQPLRTAETMPTSIAFELTMHDRTTAAVRQSGNQTPDDEAVELTLRALAQLDTPSTVLELSKAIRDHFNATASPSRIYVSIGRLWERGQVTVAPVRITRGTRSTRQTVVTLTARGRTAVATMLAALSEEEDAARSAASVVEPNLARRRP